MRYIRILPILAIALISCNGGNKQTAKKEIPPPRVEVIIAQEQEFPAGIEVNGTVLSEEMVELRTEISGRITFLNLPDGASVKQGTVLVRINDADLQAELAKEKSVYELAQKTEKRLRKLLAGQGIDQATYDAALNAMNSSEASVNVLKAQIDKTVVKAPFDGKLGLRQVSMGAFVTPQTLLGTLQQSDKVKIDFTVPEAYVKLVGIGSTVMVQTNASDEKLQATISAVEPQINESSRNIKVRARLNSGTLYPGAFVKVILTQIAKGIVVPGNAIIPDAQSNQVIVVKNGKGVFKNVETGTRTADVVEITDGLVNGDTVVVSGVLFVRPNASLIIKGVKKLSELK
ncbi:MAG: efflux RND transporter periplasmic adaptor subunit [Bacteroidota bacterium]